MSYGLKKNKVFISEDHDKFIGVEFINFDNEMACSWHCNNIQKKLGGTKLNSRGLLSVECLGNTMKIYQDLQKLPKKEPGFWYPLALYEVGQ